MPGIRLERLTKVYDGEVLAVDDVTITGPTDDLKIELKSDGGSKPTKIIKEGGSEFAK